MYVERTYLLDCVRVWLNLHAEPYVGVRGLAPGALEQVLNRLS